MAHVVDLDTLGFEPRAFRMRSACDTTTPCAQLLARARQALIYILISNPGLSPVGVNFVAVPNATKRAVVVQPSLQQQRSDSIPDK